MVILTGCSMWETHIPESRHWIIQTQAPFQSSHPVWPAQPSTAQLSQGKKWFWYSSYVVCSVISDSIASHTAPAADLPWLLRNESMNISEGQTTHIWYVISHHHALHNTGMPNFSNYQDGFLKLYFIVGIFEVQTELMLYHEFHCFVLKLLWCSDQNIWSFWQKYLMVLWVGTINTGHGTRAECLHINNNS